MKSAIRKIALAGKECFKTDKKMTFEKKKGQYVVYQNSNIFWIPVKTKLISCEDLETLKEIDRRCLLGLSKRQIGMEESLNRK